MSSRKQLELPGYARLVPFSEIEANEYNLNIPRYIDSSEPEDIHDLHAHLNGGIPQRDIDAPGRLLAGVPHLAPQLVPPQWRAPATATPLVATAQVKGDDSATTRNLPPLPDADAGHLRGLAGGA